MNLPLERSGFGGQGPAPGLGQDKRFPGLIVMLSTTKAGAGKNLAGLFDIVGVTDSSADKTQLWATWQAGKPNFGTGASTVYVAMAGDTNHDGILNDAPNEVPVRPRRRRRPEGPPGHRRVEHQGGGLHDQRLTALRTLSSEPGRRAFARGAPSSFGRRREGDR
jgi:hypothetical protein